MERPAYGTANKVADRIRSLLANNPSAATYWGTNSYLIGRSELAIVDPGPDDPTHLRALMTAIGNTPVKAILLTHTHDDHSGCAAALSKGTGAPILGFGTADIDSRRFRYSMSLDGLPGTGEGVDTGYRPGRTLKRS